MSGRYTYGWNPGTPHQSMLKKIDAEEFQQERERIERVYGKFTSKLLAQEAKAKDHLAHGFIYNVGQKRAAELHYEYKARTLIQAHRIIAVDHEPVNVRAQIAIAPHEFGDDESGHHHYYSAPEISASPKLRDIERTRLLRQMNLLRSQLIFFDEFTEVVAAIDRAMEQAA